MSNLVEGHILRVDGKTVYSRRKNDGLHRTRVVVRKRHNTPKRRGARTGGR